MADQPPTKDKKAKKKAKLATDELQGASKSAAQNSSMGKKRKKRSEHTAAAAATQDLQGTSGTGAMLEHLPQAGSATQADAPADIPAAGAHKPGLLFQSRFVTGSSLLQLSKPQVGLYMHQCRFAAQREEYSSIYNS